MADTDRDGIETGRFQSVAPFVFLLLQYVLHVALNDLLYNILYIQIQFREGKP